MFQDIYTAHPNFGKEFDELRPESSLTCQINALGFLADRKGTFLKETAKEELSNNCHTILEKIFSSLAAQATAQLQKDFLSDLRSEAMFLAGDDLNWFFRETQIDKSAQTLAREDPLPYQKLEEEGFFTTTIGHRHIISLLGLADEIRQDLDKQWRGQAKREELSINSGAVVSKVISIVDEAFNESGLNNAMSAYCGRDMRVQGLAVETGSKSSTWWKSIYTNTNKPPATLYMHRDETRAAPKAFIYLTDISRGNGAFSVIPNADKFHGKPSWLQTLVGRRIGVIGRSQSHSCHGRFKHVYHQAFGDAAFRSLFMSLPSDMRYSSHYGWDLLNGSSLHDQLLKDELWMEGSAGSTILFDGARITHRALVGSDSSHLSIQAIFYPIPQETHAGTGLIGKAKSVGRALRRLKRNRS